MILIDESSLPHESTMLLAVVATIGISVFAHGMTSRPLTGRYVGWYASHPPRGAAGHGEPCRLPRTAGGRRSHPGERLGRPRPASAEAE